ncbi:MAG: glycosyltransferase family 39 protein [Flavobacteriales bacterium]
MGLLQKPHRTDLLLIAGGAMLLRLAMLPWAQTVQADAVSRIHIALEWLQDPHWITHGYWGPLHHYLNALFMLVFPGKALGPQMLSVLAASLTAIPLYGFTLKVFGSRRGAVFAALLYVFSPIALWTSLQALSEVTYGFFLASALFALSLNQGQPGAWRSAAVAGLLMTCAAATRYEAWVLIAALSLVAFLLHGWRIAVVFWACAMLFPAVWMAGNQIEFGDALYSVNQNDEWNMGKEGINDDVTKATRIQRVIFFGWSFVLNSSPVCALLLLLATAIAVVRRKLTRPQWIWLIPFAAMALIFQKKAWEGSLMLHHRFVVTWLILLLPFVALVFTVLRSRAIHRVIMPLGVIITLPFAFLFGKIDFTKLLGERALSTAMDGLVLGHYREVQVVPRLYGNDTEGLLTVINAQTRAGDGLILDFHAWDASYYILLHALPNTMVVGGAKHEGFKPEEAVELLATHKQGVMVFSRTGMLQHMVEWRGGVMRLQGIEMPLAVSEPIALRGTRLFQYRVIATDDSLAKASEAEPLRAVLPAAKDLEYYDQLIRGDEAWFASVRRQAFWKRESIDEALRRNAEYMIWLDDQTSPKSDSP